MRQGGLLMPRLNPILMPVRPQSLIYYLNDNHNNPPTMEDVLHESFNDKANFKHIVSEKKYEIHTSGDKLKVVETVPGWSHSITNTGNEEMVVLLWANEIFNPDEPDTTSYDI